VQMAGTTYCTRPLLPRRLSRWGGQER